MLAAQGYDTYVADPGRALAAFLAPGCTSFVAADGDSIVGFTQIQSDGQIQAHLSHVVTHRDYRHRGIASKLIRLAFEEAGGIRIDLLAAAGSEAFYESFSHRAGRGYRIYPDVGKTKETRQMKFNPEVERLLEEAQHPLDAEIRRVREIILAADDRIEEAVKWKSPTFVYKGNIASYFMNAKKHVSLMFHKGAMIDDGSGLLEGDGKEARSAKFYGLEDIEEKRETLESVVREWIRIRDAA